MAINNKVPVAIIGPGNIGTDLIYKIERSRYIRVGLVAGVKKDSTGILLAQEKGVPVSLLGAEGIIQDLSPIVIDATSASVHIKNAPLFRELGKKVIDLTPAALGPKVIPVINLSENLDELNINMVTCGGQMSIPIVKAVSQVVEVPYSEVICTIASLSAGPGTRQNIDEFTQTTARAIESLGGAQRGKAIIILNPAEPPIISRATIYCLVDEDLNDKKEQIEASVENMAKRLQTYVPGYRLKVPPQFDGNKVTVMVEVEGAGDFLPKYSGNLDIMTSAAVAVAEEFAKKMSKEGRP